MGLLDWFRDKERSFTVGVEGLYDYATGANTLGLSRGQLDQAGNATVNQISNVATFGLSGAVRDEVSHGVSLAGDAIHGVIGRAENAASELRGAVSGAATWGKVGIAVVGIGAVGFLLLQARKIVRG